MADGIRERNSCSPVVLNVDGARFRTSWEELRRKEGIGSRLFDIAEPNKKVSDIEELCDKYDVENNEIYFNKRNKNFGEIIEFYRTGKLHFGGNDCVMAFVEELKYWNIAAEILEDCCLNNWIRFRKIVRWENVKLPTSCAKIPLLRTRFPLSHSTNQVWFP